MNNQYMNQHNQTYWIPVQNSFIAGFSTKCAPVKGVTHLEIIETMSPRYFMYYRTQLQTKFKRILAQSMFS